MTARDWPRISIVTPSYNQAQFLERTICSVLDQHYPNLEFIVMDGGSTDGSLDIIRKYERYLTVWRSEPDGGQSDAVNKGFTVASGAVFGWQNSDDEYAPGSFAEAARVFCERPEAGIVFGNMLVIDEHGNAMREHRYTTFSRLSLIVEGMNLHNTSAFWRRGVWERTGGLDASLRFAMDFDFFIRASRGTKCVHVPRVFGRFRRHGSAKTTNMGATVGSAEIAAIRARELPLAAGGGALGKVAWLGLRGVAASRRAIGYAAQGDWRYLTRGVLRRFSGRRGNDGSG